MTNAKTQTPKKISNFAKPPGKADARPVAVEISGSISLAFGLLAFVIS
jgi:hypothetical protein